MCTIGPVNYGPLYQYPLNCVLLCFPRRAEQNVSDKTKLKPNLQQSPSWILPSG